MRTRALPALALLLAASIACRSRDATPAGSVGPAPNILVVLVDTLRADRLSLYGYERETSPNLDRFARERGVVFENSWANAGCTFPSVNSILTGRWPQLFTSRFATDGMTIPADVTTLGERLGALGYSTAAVSASQIVRATPSKINERGGFGRGFQVFDERCVARGAACVDARAFEQLDRLAEPFFLYLHYLDPHAPYRPPGRKHWRWAGASAEGVAPWASVGETQPIQRTLYDRDTAFDFGDAEVRHLNDLYDEEIHFFDRHLGRLLAELDRRGLSAHTVVAFVADHGEELYDHGDWAHCRDLVWETILATPFVLAVPGIEPGVRRTLVSNIDLMPTLLELAGVDDPAHGLDGSSLVPLLARSEDAPSSRRAFAWQGVRRAARDASLKVRLNLLGGEPSFVELRPGSTGREPGRDRRRSELLAALIDWIERAESADRAAGVRDAEHLEAELKALGYL